MKRTLVAGGIPAKPRLDSPGQVVDVRRLARPALDPDERQAVLPRGRAGTLEVDAHRHRRVVRGQHEADDLLGARLGEHVDGRLDARIDVSQTDGDGELAGGGIVEGGGDRRALRLGALGERAEPADRLVAGGEVGELLVARRPPRRMSV